ncbi:hypothetical protein J6590_010672 [Homalodisca vitripennis]|nr:hypothetical protein J6590_010672 [Homalodisca vitripennis]
MWQVTVVVAVAVAVVPGVFGYQPYQYSGLQHRQSYNLNVQNKLRTREGIARAADTGNCEPHQTAARIVRSVLSTRYRIVFVVNTLKITDMFW